MKKIVFIICLMIGFVTSSQANSFRNGLISREHTKQLLDKEIQRHLFFPLMQKMEAATVVTVVLSVQADGTLKIINTSSANDEAKAFVVNRLQTIVLDKTEVTVGEVFHYTFRFKRQA